jgi:hypothetical protein
LVEQKEATIQLLKERVNSLESQLKQTKEESPDVLAERLVTWSLSLATN